MKETGEKIKKPNKNSIVKMQKYRLWIFLACAAAYFISYFHRAAPAVVGPEIIDEFLIAPAALGLMGSMYFWAYAAAVLPAGILADTWGSRNTVSAFVLVAAIGGIIFGLAPNISILSAGRFVVGFGFGFVYVPALRIMTDWYRPDELATYSGMLIAIGNIGAMLSAAPLVLLMNSIGWRNSFYVVGVITVAAAVLAYTVIRNKPGDKGFPSPREIMGLPPATVQSIKIGEALKAVFSNSRFYLLSILLFSYYGTLMGTGSLWAGPYLQHVYGLSKEAAGSIIMMFPLGMIFGSPLAGYLSDKVLKSRKKVLLGGALLHCTAYLPLVFLNGQLPLTGLYGLFFWYGLSGGAFVCCFACSKEIFEPRIAGIAIGAINMFLFAGGAFYQYIMGVVIGKYPVLSTGEYSSVAYKAAFTVPLIGMLVGVFLFLFFREEASVK